MGCDHLVVGDILIEIRVGVEILEAVGGKIAAVEGGLALDDVLGDEQSGHGMVAEASGAKISAQEKAG